MGRASARELAALRLRAQRLTGPPYASPGAAVGAMGAVQAQDYPAACWALSLRTGAGATTIDRLFDEGALLRTHVLRPTWHLILPSDVRWLQELTGGRIVRGLAGRYRQLELDESQVMRALDAMAGALAGGHHLTRAELGAVLQRAGVSPEGQRLPHLLARAEHQALIVSGPRRAGQFTWALLEERAPDARRLPREEALVELVVRYFRGHGPAQVQDFAWWSGLSVADARAGLAAAGPALERIEVEGSEYWLDAGLGEVPGAGGCVHLLPNFDEYTVGYRDRSPAIDPDRPPDLAGFAFGSILSNVVTVAGRVRGSWRLDRGRVEARIAHPLAPAEAAALAAASARLEAFRRRER